ncbi:MAG TPA: hypothetical protein VKQ27_03965 [Acetobacteraceae bacterium]|nr:hypothetical protein [Acetobacteraceae bacterium]
MKMINTLAAGALMLAATFGAAAAQSLPEGRVYVFHSTAQGACPALDWDIVVRANNTLSGTIAWDDMKSIAYATGGYDMVKRTFKMSAQEIRGHGRTATVDGQIRQDGWLIANIHGPKVTCLGIAVPWYTPPAGAGAG